MSDHFDGRRFFNPGQPTTDRSLRDLLRWRLRTVKTPWERTPQTRPSVQPAAREPGLRITMVGHASVLIQIAGCNLLVDPVWSQRASPVSWAGPQRFDAPGIAFDALPLIDAVLVTHNHYDHCDLPTLRKLAQAHGPRVIAPLGNEALLAKAVPAAAIVTADWGETIAATADVSVTLTPAHHWSARRLGDRRRALWCGFLVRGAGRAAYVVGDTGLGDGRIFAALRERHGAPDVAIIPIGAYEPRWFMKDQHVNPQEAVALLQACGAGQGLGVHWGTFRLTDEGREAPREALAAALREAGLAPERFTALEAGAVWSLEHGTAKP